MTATKAGAILAEVSGPHLVQLNYQQISAATLATSQALTVPAGTIEALIQCTGGVVRWRADAEVPTAAVGGRINDGDAITIRGGHALAAFKAILSSGAPVLDVTYWG